MKIGDVVSYAAGLDRHPEFGRLIDIKRIVLGTRRVEILSATILRPDGTCITRELKRVKTVEAGQKHAGLVAKRNAKRRIPK